MYCILVAGIPAAGKSALAEALSERFHLPVLSKDSIKELLFDTVGFQSRKEKVNLGIASMEIMYYMAGQLMKTGQAFILENNFEYLSKHGIENILEQYQYSALTITLTGDYKAIYQRFLERERSPDRHRGHVVNDSYPERKRSNFKQQKTAPISYENYVQGIAQRGFEAFLVEGKQITVDTTDFSKIDMEELFSQIRTWQKNFQVI